MYGFGIFAKGLKPDLSFGKDNPSIDNRPTFPTIVNLKAFFIVISGRITSSFFREMISVRFSTIYKKWNKILFARFGSHGGLTISGIETDNQAFNPPNSLGAVYELPEFGTSIDLLSINNTFYIIGGHGYVKVS